MRRKGLLRDVQVPTKRKPITRPIGVRYYASPTAPQHAYAKSTAASTPVGAVRGAVLNVLIGKYAKALLFERETGTPTFIDGARVLDITGNWPSVGQSRGVQYVKRKGRVGLAPLRHRNITTDLFKQGFRTLTTFLTDLTRAGAFASTEPKKAFFVDFGPALNPPSTQAAGEVNADVGLATARPAEFIKVRIGPDTRALDEEAAAQA
mgnify:CR=1 FL=1